jgi:hypothetical protein
MQRHFSFIPSHQMRRMQNEAFGPSCPSDPQKQTKHSQPSSHAQELQWRNPQRKMLAARCGPRAGVCRPTSLRISLSAGQQESAYLQANKN